MTDPLQELFNDITLVGDNINTMKTTFIINDYIFQITSLQVKEKLLTDKFSLFACSCACAV